VGTLSDPGGTVEPALLLDPPPQPAEISERAAMIIRRIFFTGGILGEERMLD
jgi:hypothetical protein